MTTTQITRNKAVAICHPARGDFMLRLTKALLKAILALFLLYGHGFQRRKPTQSGGLRLSVNNCYVIVLLI